MRRVDVLHASHAETMKMITVLVAVAAAAALTPTAAAQEVYCNAGFILLGDNSCIKVFTDKVTWQRASQACQDIDNYVAGSPHLAHINDCALLSSVWDYIHYQLQLKDQEFWLGGSDTSVEGSWEWENLDPVPKGIPFWYPGEPDGGILENHLVLAHNGYFADAHGDQKYGYICQYLPNMKTAVTAAANKE